MDTKEKSSHRSLDQRIADALNGEIVTSASLSDLIIEVEDALPISTKALESREGEAGRPEQLRLREDQGRPSTRSSLNCSASKPPFRCLKALPPAQHHERRKLCFLGTTRSWTTTTRVRGFRGAYNAFCQQFVPMLEAAVKLNDAIRKSMRRAVAC